MEVVNSPMPDFVCLSESLLRARAAREQLLLREKEQCHHQTPDRKTKGTQRHDPTTVEKKGANTVKAPPVGSSTASAPSPEPQTTKHDKSYNYMLAEAKITAAAEMVLREANLRSKIPMVNHLLLSALKEMLEEEGAERVQSNLVLRGPLGPGDRLHLWSAGRMGRPTRAGIGNKSLAKMAKLCQKQKHLKQKYLRQIRRQGTEEKEEAQRRPQPAGRQVVSEKDESTAAGLRAPGAPEMGSTRRKESVEKPLSKRAAQEEVTTEARDATSSKPEHPADEGATCKLVHIDSRPHEGPEAATCARIAGTQKNNCRTSPQASGAFPPPTAAASAQHHAVPEESSSVKTIHVTNSVDNHRVRLWLRESDIYTARWKSRAAGIYSNEREMSLEMSPETLQERRTWKRFQAQSRGLLENPCRGPTATQGWVDELADVMQAWREWEAEREHVWVARLQDRKRQIETFDAGLERRPSQVQVQRERAQLLLRQTEIGNAREPAEHREDLEWMRRVRAMGPKEFLRQERRERDLLARRALEGAVVSRTSPVDETQVETRRQKQNHPQQGHLLLRKTIAIRTYNAVWQAGIATFFTYISLFVITDVLFSEAFAVYYSAAFFFLSLGLCATDMHGLMGWRCMWLKTPLLQQLCISVLLGSGCVCLGLRSWCEAVFLRDEKQWNIREYWRRVGSRREEGGSSDRFSALGDGLGLVQHGALVAAFCVLASGLALVISLTSYICSRLLSFTVHRFCLRRVFRMRRTVGISVHALSFITSPLSKRQLRFVICGTQIMAAATGCWMATALDSEKVETSRGAGAAGQSLYPTRLYVFQDGANFGSLSDSEQEGGEGGLE
eukprot:g5930.t1